MEKDLSISLTTDTDALVSRILADYGTIKGIEDKHPEIKKLTFKEVYEQFMKWKFPEGAVYSESARGTYTGGFRNSAALHDRIFEDIKAPDMQAVIDECQLKRASLENILILFKQMYKYAVYAEIVTENKAQYVKINVPEDDEHGTSFTDEELSILWEHSSTPDVQSILILCYSGWRIGEFPK